MQPANRLEQFGSEPDPVKRGDGYFRLERKLAKGIEEPLKAGEADRIPALIQGETDAYPREGLWRLLLRQDQAESSRRFALGVLRDPQAPRRDHALQYLRERYPDEFAVLESEFASDPDPTVRLQVELGRLASKPAEALHGIIDLLGDLPLTERDSAELYVVEEGGEEHLEHLRMNAAALKGNSVFARVARELDSRLRGKRKGPLQS